MRISGGTTTYPQIFDTVAAQTPATILASFKVPSKYLDELKFSACPATRRCGGDDERSAPVNSPTLVDSSDEDTDDLCLAGRTALAIKGRRRLKLLRYLGCREFGAISNFCGVSNAKPIHRLHCSLSCHSEEKWIDRYVHGSGIVHVQQCMSGKIRVALVRHPIWKVGFVVGVVGAENAVKIFSNRH